MQNAYFKMHYPPTNPWYFWTEDYYETATWCDQAINPLNDYKCGIGVCSSQGLQPGDTCTYPGDFYGIGSSDEINS